MVHIKLCVSSNVFLGLFRLSNISIHKSSTLLGWGFFVMGQNNPNKQTKKNKTNKEKKHKIKK